MTSTCKFMVENGTDKKTFETLNSAIDYAETIINRNFCDDNMMKAFNDKFPYHENTYYKLVDDNHGIIIRSLPVMEEGDNLKLYYLYHGWAGDVVVIARNRKDAVDHILKKGNAGQISDIWEMYYSLDCQELVDGVIINNYGDQ